MSEHHTGSRDKSERERCFDALPFYVNGTLPVTERQFVEQCLNKYPDLVSQLEWYQSMQEHVRSVEGLRLEGISEHVGAKRLRYLLAQEAGQMRAASQPALGERCRQWWRALTEAHWLPYGFVAASVIMLAQGAGLSVLLSHRQVSEDEYDMTRSGAKVVRKEPLGYLQLSFKAETSERDLRMLLIQSGARIVDGPGQLGDYVLEVPQKRLSEASAQLQQSQWVVAVKSLPALPARSE